MKKWIGIAAILLCFGVYAMVKLSTSQYQDAHTPEEATPSAKQTDADNTDEAGPEEDSGSPGTAVQVEAVTIPAEGSGSAVPPVQVEAVIKAFSEFQSAIKSEDYEQAWELVSEFLKDSESDGSLEKFKKEMADDGAVFATATIHPESTINIEGHVGLLVTFPPNDQAMYLLFIQEDGQWKLHDARHAQSVDTSKE